MVANVLLPTPIQKLCPKVKRPPCSCLDCRTRALTRSNTPYVMAGLTVNTSPGLRPVQSPVHPLSETISRPTSNRDLPVEEEDICWRRAMTDTGIVKIWARAPASAPSASSWAVERGERRRASRAVRRDEWKKKYANSGKRISLVVSRSRLILVLGLVFVLVLALPLIAPVLVAEPLSNESRGRYRGTLNQIKQPSETHAWKRC